jgi:acetyl esterase/lipase
MTLTCRLDLTTGTITHMNGIRSFLRCCLLPLACLACLASCRGEEILLWPPSHSANGELPTNAQSLERIEVRVNPSIVPMLPTAGNRSGAAVLVCAGGGYSILAFEKEAVEIGKWLNDRGISAFCLKYRCGGVPNAHPVPLEDGLRGMRLVRSQAERWGVDPDRIGVMGFSAGGHLAACVSTLGDAGHSQAEDPIERCDSRPNFSLLIYPVISMRADSTHQGSRHNLLGEHASDELVARLSTDEQVSSSSPPTFLIHASDDKAVVVDNSIRYFRALTAHGVPAEMHIFAEGGHGFGMRPTGHPVDAWPELADKWLRAQGLAK